MLAASVLAASVLACGSSAGDGPAGAAGCGVFAACGGDPSGTWRAQDACLPSDAVSILAAGFPAECSDGIVLENAAQDSTLTIGADGAFSEQGNVTIDWSLSFDQPCIQAALPPTVQVDAAVVADFCTGLESNLAGADGPFDQVTCDVIGGVCSCTALQLEAVDQSGALTVEGNQLAYVGGPRQDFCAAGDVLQLAAPAGVGLDGAYVVYERATP